MLSRYHRQILLPEVGTLGQEALTQAKVLIIGAGGLGVPVIQYLAAAGVGQLGIIDPDQVSLSNLQRQTLYHPKQVGQFKVVCAKAWIKQFNAAITVDIYAEALSAQNASHILSIYDLIIDASDNFATKYLINATCRYLKKTWIYASVLKFTGQGAIFEPEKGPCYRCLFPILPPPHLQATCSEAGVIGALVGIIGSWQAMTAIHWIIKLADLPNALIEYNALTWQWRQISFKLNPKCQCHLTEDFNKTILELEGIMCAQSNPFAVKEITVEELHASQEQGEDYFLLDVRDLEEYANQNLHGSSIPLAQLPSRLSEVPRGQKVIVHCLSGSRSMRAATFLKDAGFDDVSSLTGGMRAWIEKYGETPATSKKDLI